jgi:AcrR family transcriptional regulator
VRVLDTDLTTYARVRNAALDGFAHDGVAATSIRDIAKAAQVSSGLVQHHFPTKADLIAAVNDYVIQIATDAFDEPPADGSSAEIQQELGDRVTALMREHPTALLYVARAAADRDEAALGLFDAFVAIALGQWQALADKGLLRSDADLTWCALHVVVLNLGTALLTDAINRHLPTPFLSDTQLERWNSASNALFREGMYRNSTGSAGSRSRARR